MTAWRNCFKSYRLLEQNSINSINQRERGRDMRREGKRKIHMFHLVSLCVEVESKYWSSLVHCDTCEMDGSERILCIENDQCPGSSYNKWGTAAFQLYGMAGEDLSRPPLWGQRSLKGQGHEIDWIFVDARVDLSINGDRDRGLRFSPLSSKTNILYIFLAVNASPTLLHYAIGVCLVEIL